MASPSSQTFGFRCRDSAANLKSWQGPSPGSRAVSQVRDFLEGHHIRLLGLERPATILRRTSLSLRAWRGSIQDPHRPGPPVGRLEGAVVAPVAVAALLSVTITYATGASLERRSGTARLAIGNATGEASMLPLVENDGVGRREVPHRRPSEDRRVRSRLGSTEAFRAVSWRGTVSGEIRGSACGYGDRRRTGRRGLGARRGASLGPAKGEGDRPPHRCGRRSVQTRFERHEHRLIRIARNLGTPDQDDDGIEVVVVPDAADPQRVGLLEIGEGSEQEQEGGDAQTTAGAPR